MGSDDDSDFSDNFEEEMMEVEPTTKGKAGASKSGKGAKGMKGDTVSSGGLPSADNSEQVSSTTGKRRSLAVEEKYQKMTQREHIIKRPDTYIGSVEKLTQEMWVYDSLTGSLVYRDVTFVPGFYKIFDEILVNAADNKQNDPSMNTIRVTIDREKGKITVWNNGKGIPVVIHKQYNIYVPSLIFGHLLTGGNFNDDEKKVTGGRNGYGAKLTNIYSKEFSVETADKSVKKKFSQTWRNNMSVAEDPIITNYNGSEYTQITYTPDLSLFGMDGFDDDIMALMEKRVLDMAGVSDSSLKVYLNGKQMEVKNFDAYTKKYQMDSSSVNTKENKLVYTKAGERWEVAVGVSDGHFQQVSFVNSICTSKGGKHVDYIAAKLVDYLSPLVKKKTKKDVKPMMIKQYLYIFVNCKIENPSFDSQTKECMHTVVKNFGSLPVFDEKFLTKVAKCGIVEAVTSFSNFKDDQMMKKQSGTKTNKKLNIPKLEEANRVGGPESHKCTLIITEGDSAKSLVMSGLSIVGRDYYGVFPLRGKMLNVRDISRQTVTKNEEIKNLVQIIGLKYNTVYTSTKDLRYGHLVIMADQDYDGSHIKGLVINFIQFFWPSLLKLDFLQQFITPIVKATPTIEYKQQVMRRLERASGRGGRAKKSDMPKPIMFFTMEQYKNWLVRPGTRAKDYHIKYYKGLGTSTPVEGKEYFTHLKRHLIQFDPITDQESSEIDMVFRKNRVAERKDWIGNYVPGEGVNYAQTHMAYNDFIHKELIQFSRYDNSRSIPCMVDGFKPSQRKVLFGAFKRKLKSEIKVIQFSGYISEHSAYHHGEASLNGTIVSMAQNFVGSNNINLLVPNGQFGTRMMGGKDSASARYIYTYLSPITRCIFKPCDDQLCKYIVEEGQTIEPNYYYPILPMVLVNGSEGIGTGYSTSIPNYNPVDIVNYIKALLNNTEKPQLHPWWRGFTGSIYRKASGYLVRGRIESIDDNTFVITELPIGRWTQDYKKFLTELMITDKKEQIITNFQENHTDTTVHFTIMLSNAQAEKLRGQDLYKVFKLETNVSTNNFYLFDENDKLHHYKSAEEIVEAFYAIRYPIYEKRKQMLLEQFEQSTRILRNKVRFVLAVVNGEIKVQNRPRKELLDELVAMGFDGFKPIEKKVLADGTFVSGNELAQEQEVGDGNKEEEEEEEEEEEMTETKRGKGKRKVDDDDDDDDYDGKTSARGRANARSKTAAKARTGKRTGKDEIKEGDGNGQSPTAGQKKRREANMGEDDHLLTPGVTFDATTMSRSTQYRYLLDMKLWSLTMEEVDHLRAKLKEEEEAMEVLRATPIKQMWEEDLDEFIEELMNMENERLAEKKMEARGRRKVAREFMMGYSSSSSSRQSDAGMEGSDDSDSMDDSDLDGEDEYLTSSKKKRKAPAARLTPKQRELANLQERANKIQSRFSISNYSKSQVVNPTPEMLATVEDLINPETGEVMNPTKKGSRGKKAAKIKKEEGEGEGGEGGEEMEVEGEKKGKKKTKGTASKTKRKKEGDMDLEEDVAGQNDEMSSSEDMMDIEKELYDDDDDDDDGESSSEDDVIRDNRAARAAKENEMEKIASEMDGKQATTATITSSVPTTTKRSVKRAKPTVEKEGEEKEKEKPTKGSPRAPKTTTTARAAKTAKTAKTAKAVEVEEETTRKKKEEEGKVANSIMEIEEDEDEEDLPLSARLMMKNKSLESIVKQMEAVTSGPSAKKVKTAAKETKKPARKTTKKAAKKDEDDDSEDSLFGF